MAEKFKPPFEAVPWTFRANSAPLADFKAVLEKARQLGEPFGHWCHRMNTSDDPEAVEFRRRWAQTESGRRSRE